MQRMTRRTALAAGAATVLGATATATATATLDAAATALGGFSVESLAKIPPILQTSVDTGDTPGIVSLIWRKGEVVQVNTAGFRDIERKLPMDRSTIFAIASMTKPVTVALALTLIDQGKMKLDDPITKWAPEFANMRVLKRPDGPLDETYPAPRTITIEDLMTHRSGLAYGFLSSGPLAGALMSKIGFGIDSALSPDEWMKTLAGLPLAYAPGERFNYGHSIDVLGLIVGRATRTSLRQAMHERICAPLGMIDTDFWIPPAKRERAATIYNAGMELKAFTPAHVSAFSGPAPQGFVSGGQGLVSTADDYLTFARMLLQGGAVNGRRLLKPETVRLMTTNQLTPAQRRIPTFVAPPWAVAGFGLGVSLITDPQAYPATGWGVGSAGSFGWPGAFGGWWQADPVQDLVLLWLVEATPPAPSGPIMAMPRFPGRLAMIAFQKQTYAALPS